MKRIDERVQERARTLRGDGLTPSEISAELTIPLSAAKRWTADLPLTADQRAAATARASERRGKAVKEAFRAKRAAAQVAGRERAKLDRPLHRTGCMLYWAEGEKQRNSLSFANSDPQMLALYLRFLREELVVDDSEIELRVHAHKANGIAPNEVEKYWREALDFKPGKVGLIWLDDRMRTRKRRNVGKLPYGVATLRVHKTELVMHVFGAIQEYGGFDRPEWLG